MGQITRVYKLHRLHASVRGNTAERAARQVHGVLYTLPTRAYSNAERLQRTVQAGPQQVTRDIKPEAWSVAGLI